MNLLREQIMEKCSGKELDFDGIYEEIKDFNGIENSK
jgi:hypothetical protein